MTPPGADGQSASIGDSAVGFERVWDDWSDLADQTRASPFLRPEWFAIWWEAFGRGSPEFVTAWSSGRLRGVLPIVHRHGAIRSPTNWHTPEFRSLSADKTARGALLREVFARRPNAVSMKLLNVSAAERWEIETIAACAGYRTQTRLQERSLHVDVDGRWDAYIDALGGSFRRDLLRRRRRLEQLGPVTLDVQESDAALREALELEHRGWKGKRGTAICSHRSTAHFYAAIAGWAGERGCLRLAFLRVGERAIAFHLALEEGGVYYALKGGFDPAFHPYSPGGLIIHATLQRAFATGLRRYEFLGGDEEYKRRWATASSDRIAIDAYAPTIRGRVRDRAASLRLVARTTIRGQPRSFEDRRSPGERPPGSRSGRRYPTAA